MINKRPDEFKSLAGKVDHLEYCAKYENTEVGEHWSALSRLCGYTYCMDDDFVKALEAEVDSQIMFLHSDWEWVEEEETYTRKTKRLKHYGE
jgi:hypothetical protein